MTDSNKHSHIWAQFRAARLLTRSAAIAAAPVASLPAPQQPPASLITLPMPSLPAAASKINPSTESGLHFSKSYAQVETLVRPQVVSPKSCELKLGRQRPYRLMGRFSKQEKEDVEAKATVAGLSVNEYIRATSLGGQYTPPNPAELVRELLALKRELTAQGNNLNQIARQANAGIISAAEADSMVGMVARSILQTQRAVREALSKGREMPPEP